MSKPHAVVRLADGPADNRSGVLRRLGIAAAATVAVASTLLLPAQAFGASGTVAKPAAPALVSPADDPTAASPLKDIALHWDAVSGATGYQVEVSPNGQWSNNTVTLPGNGQTVATTYDLPVSLPHASYFWRVRALDGSTAGSWSSARQFLHEWDAASNDDGSFTMLTTPSTTPLFSWTPVKDASEYVVRVSDNPSFPPSSPTTFTCFTSGTSLAPYTLDSGSAEGISGGCFKVSDLADGTMYYWYVRPLDDSSAAPITADTVNDPNYDCAQALPECDGYTQSGTFTFQAPASGSPTAQVTGLTATWTDGTTTSDCTNAVCPTTPTLSWDAVTGADDYDVHVYLDPDDTNTYRDYETPFTTLTPRDLYFGNQAGRSYYWVVTAGTANASAPMSPSAGGPSAVSTFKVQTGTVTPTAPADGATVNPASLTFAWSDYLSSGGQGATEARNYDLQVATDSDFNNVVKNVSSVDMTQYSPTAALKSGTYFWRVAAIDEAGHQLAWSNSRQVTVDASAPKVSLATRSGVAVNGTFTLASNQALQGVVTGNNSPSFKLQPATGGGTVSGSVTKVTAQRWRFRPNAPLVTGQTYALVLGSGLTDSAGNSAVVSGSPVRTTTTADNTSAGWSSTGRWAQHKSSNAKGGSYVVAGKGATATIHVAGSKATFYACKAPRYGTETVTVDGKTVARLSLSHRYTQCGMRLWSGSLKSGQHTLRIKVTKGTGDLDEVTVG